MTAPALVFAVKWFLIPYAIACVVYILAEAYGPRP
jgi:hypothetical protein